MLGEQSESHITADPDLAEDQQFLVLGELLESPPQLIDRDI
jgi:hypothetical protein